MHKKKQFINSSVFVILQSTHEVEWRIWNGMIDCITSCIAGLLQRAPSADNTQAQSRTNPSGSPNRRNNNNRTFFFQNFDSKQDFDVDSSSNYLLQEENRATNIELQRQEQIEKYTSQALLYKQPINASKTNNTKDEIPLECVMW